ncbi:MAG: hypothetical protein EP349_01365 [Alphaproteobacteria bacterium]|nr:MAG: hypothetical protein EP349_01365 [Alphaproteobacteria bacterium]
MQQYMTLNFVPLMPWQALVVLGAAAFVLFVLALLRGARGTWWRGLALVLVLLVLSNPSVMQEQREPIKDTVLVVTDNTPSEKVGQRPALVAGAMDNIRKQLEALPNVEPVYLTVEAQEDETRLWSAMREAVLEQEENALAGVILVTDGQVHDAPAAPLEEERLKNIPIHTVYTGAKDEKDISVIVTQAPRYALTGDTVTVTVRIDAQGYPKTQTEKLRLEVMQDGDPVGVFPVVIGEERKLSFKMEHAGDTVLSFTVPRLEGELTAANNTAFSIIRAVRDRLRVLLVSGKPHAGERTWRNLLNSDPAVDLVHFTILRSPEAKDPTPSHELSLIAFPTHELFQRKIKNFDLIVFDRYHLQGILQGFYMRNIREYVKNGGALLMASGDEYGGQSSLYQTAVRDILPARPLGGTIENGFIPEKTDLGDVHPVTERLTDKQQAWGRWFRQVKAEVAPTSRILMMGAEKYPLLVLDKAEKGRVAWLASDHTWLWARGLEHGGPQKELLRRLVHWLMKEPELEENRLVVSVNGFDLTVRRRALLDVDKNIDIAMFTPEQEQKTLTLRREDLRRWQRGDAHVEQYGLYRFEDPTSGQKAFAVVGRIDVPEMQQVIASNEKLSPLTAATGGGEIWYREAGQGFALRHGAGFAKLKYYGDDWIAVKKNDAYRVTGLKSFPLLPPLWAMLVIALVMMIAWYREGRSGTPQS